MSAVLPVITENLSHVYAVIQELERKVNCLEEKVTEQAKTITDQAELIANLAKRITTTEKIFFKHDEEGDIIRDEEDLPILSMSFSCASSEPVSQQETIVPETTLDFKTCAVVDHLKEAVEPNEFGVFAIDKKILDVFMTEEISENLRVKKVSRQLKKDIFKRAVELFPTIVEIVIGKSGNKTKSLALKTSVKRSDTSPSMRSTGLGIWA